MKRMLALAVLGLALMSGKVSANGWWSPGYVQVNGGVSLSFGHKNGVQPYQLGPWYLYFPYEAHFQQPALPQYPYWQAATLPNGQTTLGAGMTRRGPAPSYWGH